MPARRLCSTLLLVCLWPVGAWAQQGWDPEAYTALIAASRTLREQAQSEAEGSTARRDRMVESLSANRRAQHMLREAILAGAVDAYRADAVTELFNLSDNIIVGLIAAGQCEAAAVERERLSADGDLIPVDVGDHLETLRRSVNECRERVATAPAAWNPAAYAASQAQAEQWRGMASSAATEELRLAALYEATTAEGEALRRLREAALEGVPVSGVEVGRQLGVHYNRVVTSLLDMGLCEAAAHRVSERDATLSALDGGASLSSYATQLERCRVAAAAGGSVAPSASEPLAAAEPIVVERAANPGPWVLIGVAGASAVAALAVDLTLIGDRDDFDRLKSECGGVDLSCHEAVQTLGDSIDRQKIFIGVFAGLAVAAGAAGLVWLLTTNDDEVAPRASLEVTPMAGPDLFGASVLFTH